MIDEVNVEHEWLFLQAKRESVVTIYPGPDIEITFVHLEVKNPVSTAVCGENKTRHVIASLSKHRGRFVPKLCVVFTIFVQDSNTIKVIRVLRIFSIRIHFVFIIILIAIRLASFHEVHQVLPWLYDL